MRDPSGDQSVGSQYTPGHGSSAHAGAIGRRNAQPPLFQHADPYANPQPIRRPHWEEIGTGRCGDADGPAVVEVLDPDVGIAPHRIDHLQGYPPPVRGQRGQPCGWRSEIRTAVPSRATVPSRTPHYRRRHRGEQIRRRTQHRRVYGVFAPAVTGNVRDPRRA